MKIKKLGLLALTLGLALSLAACGEEDLPKNPNDDTKLPDDDSGNTEKPDDTGNTEKPDDNQGEKPDTKDEVLLVKNVAYAKDTKTVSWDKADSAMNYVVNVNNTIFNSKTTSLTLEESFLTLYEGCHIEIKVYAENTTKRGSYSDVLSVLVGEDTVTDEEFSELVTQLEIPALSEEKVEAFLTDNGITKKELMNLCYGNLVVSKSIGSKIETFLFREQLDATYTDINPSWTEGQEKKLVKYIDDNFDKVANDFETLLSVTNLMKNSTLLEALGRFGEIQNGAMNLQSLLDLYNNVQLQINEAIPTEQNVAELFAIMEDVYPIFLEENAPMAVKIYYMLYPEEAEELQSAPEKLTEEQLQKLGTEVSGVLGNVENILNSVIALTQNVYSSISEEALQDIANIKQVVTANNKYLLNENMLKDFKTQYLCSVIEKCVWNILQKEDSLNQISGIVTELNTIANKKVIVNLMDNFMSGLPGLESLGDIKVSELLQGVLSATTKEEIAALLHMADLALEPTIDAEYIAASIYSSYYFILCDEVNNNLEWSEEQKEEKLTELSQLNKDANVVIIKVRYAIIRNIYTNMEDEELSLIASNVESIVVSKMMEQYEELIDSNLSDIEYYQSRILELNERIQECQKSAQEIEEMHPEATAYISNIYEELKVLEAKRQDDTITDEEMQLYEEKQQQVNDYIETHPLANLWKYKALCDQILTHEQYIINATHSIEFFENNIEEMNAYIELFGNFLTSEHDYAENYMNILKNIQSLVVNLTPEQLAECMDTVMEENDLTDAAIITVSNLIASCNGEGLLEDIISNVKVVLSDEILSVMDLSSLIEKDIEPLIAIVLEVGTYDVTSDLTSEQLEKVNLIKEFLVSLF